MDNKPGDTLKQIQAAWQNAQGQVGDLREQVEYLARLAQAKVQQTNYERDLDKAFRDLGESIWAQVSKGKLQLPNSMPEVMKSLAAVTKKIQDQNRSLNDLLAEGAEIANRLREKITVPPPNLKVAPKDKKR